MAKPYSKSNSSFLKRLNAKDKPVLVFDGATGTSLQLLELNADDFGGVKYEGCNENLVLSCVDAVSKVHRDFLEVGCDVIETNTFGANSIVLAEYDLSDKSYEINSKAAQIARKIADEYTTENKPRFVAGSVGPTTKLPTLGHIGFDELASSYKEQIDGLIDGGVDLILIETCQDVLQIKAALNGLERSFREKSIRIPIMVSITVEATGTMLVGTDIAAAVTILEPFDIDILGLNCATGPVEMKEHMQYLSSNSPFVTSCIPNAGLPENIGGVAHYRLTPIELKIQLLHFIEDLGVRIIGGCCGTTPEHIKELVALSDDICNNTSPQLNNRQRINTCFEGSASSIYSSTNYKQDNSFLIVGERLNASGSKKVRDLLNKEDWDGLISIAKAQVKENSHILDVNVDYVGRDGEKDMRELISRLVTNVNLPLMLDSTEYQKMESGLKVAGGKCILNSTNYEDGDQRFFKVLEIAKSHGAAVVVGTIDEDGMARTASKKFSIAKRAFYDAKNYGIKPREIFIDTLALPISTGIEEDRNNAKETIDAIKKIKRELKDTHLILGISNISFGLNPSARITLNSVFLHECCQAGLDSAIVSPLKILPLSKIDESHLVICKDLIYDRRKYEDGNCVYDPLVELTKLFEGVTTKEARGSFEQYKQLSIEECLPKHIIDGERIGLEDTLNKALDKYSALEIINKHLLEGMKIVGDLFGSGQMQLPFVLQSAETMKSAVNYLEPYMEKLEGDKEYKGIFLIATVKGDVHDIGKNLVDIILTNNGYKVINLGIKQDISTIIDAYHKFQPDCIAMSGLLVKSTAFMKDNLSAFNENSISIPVVLGGAALTPKFVNQDCNNTYKGLVIYGRDAFTDLRFMDEYMAAKKSGNWDNIKGFLSVNDNNKSFINIPSSTNLIQDNDDSLKADLQDINTQRSPFIIEEKAINPPFEGSKVIATSQIDLPELITYLDKTALFTSQWQLKKKKGQSTDDYKEYINSTIEPILDSWIDRILEERILEPSCVYGYFRCGRIGNSVLVDSSSEESSITDFVFPRQLSSKQLCIADFFKDIVNNEYLDFIPMQAVTIGAKATKFSQELYRNNQYTDYLYFHGLTVQLAEALAEYNHSIIRKECGFSHQEPNNIKDILTQKYRGCRYSFGYPACPNVSDSRKQLMLLDSSRIGLSIDDSDQLQPEQSTTAIVALHSKAKYFSV